MTSQGRTCIFWLLLEHLPSTPEPKGRSQEGNVSFQRRISLDIEALRGRFLEAILRIRHKPVVEEAVGGSLYLESARLLVE